MTQFAESVGFFVQHCCECHVPFAMTLEFEKRRRQDRKLFYCPAGHSQYYAGPNEADKLREELARKQQMIEAANSRAESAGRTLAQVTKAHRRMRQRVMNGVCPCCNRSFENLRRHMQDMHADYGAAKTLAAIRQAFGMTQAAVAQEAGVEGSHVSLYERDKQVTPYARERLEAWALANGNA